MLTHYSINKYLKLQVVDLTLKKESLIFSAANPDAAPNTIDISNVHEYGQRNSLLEAKQDQIFRLNNE